MKYYFSSPYRHSLLLLPLGFLMILGLFQESASAASLTQLSINFNQIKALGTFDNFFKNDKNANDCSGFFGSGFQNCDIGHPFDKEISKIIAKIEYNGRNQSSRQTNTSHFPTVTGSEFTINFNGNRPNSTGSGTWSYNPGENDPGVRFWVAKGGDEGFTLFWNVETSFTGAGEVCDMNDDRKKFSVRCLRLAEAVTSGTWSTPNGKGLSHITFYNGEREIPEPSTAIPVILFGLAGWYGRNKKSA